MNLAGKRALVTGGTKGIGAAVATDLAAGGATVVINGRHRDPSAENVLQHLAKEGSPGTLIQADVGRPEECERCVDEALAAMGGLEILVHSAGGPAFGRIDEITPEKWHAAFDVHVHAAYYLCRRALPALRQQGGTIVLISSAAGLRGCPGAVAYGTVKGAILQFTRMMARDLADDEIRVNCVCPGVIRTDFHSQMTAAQKAHNLENRIPLHREGTAAQVADAVRFLVTNDYMTGEQITIDAGLTMQVSR